MTHSALRSEFEQLIDVYAPVAQLGTVSPSPKVDLASGRSLSAVLRHAAPTCGGAGMPAAACARCGGRPTNTTA